MSSLKMTTPVSSATVMLDYMIDNLLVHAVAHDTPLAGARLL